MPEAKRSGTQPGMGRLYGVYWSGRSWLTLMLAGVAVWTGGAYGAAAGLAPSGRGQAEPPNKTLEAILRPSEEATTLLSRANEAIEREDWKLAIDSLQRIVELPGEHVLTADGRVYESARVHAHRRIASLPAPGLQAYRLMYDGEASALLARGLEQHDPALLRTIIDQYLLTSAGDDAAVALADWLIDEGRFSEAAAVLQRLRSLYPDSDLPAWGLSTRLAICAVNLGRRQRAEAILKQLVTTRPTGTGPATRPGGPEPRAHPHPLPPADRIDQIRAYIARTAAGRHPVQAARWPMAFGNVSRNGKMPAVEPAFIDHQPWTIQLPVAEPRQGFAAIASYAQSRTLMPVRQMVTDGQVLVVKGDRDLLALDAGSFAPLWRTRRQLDEVDLPGPGHDVSRLVFGQSGDSLDNDPVVRRLLYDALGAGVAIAFNMVLTVDRPAEPSLPAEVRSGGGRRGRVAVFGVAPAGGDSSGSDLNRVVAYSLEDGSLLWKSDTSGVGGSGSEAGPGGAEFLAVPIPVNGSLLAPCRVNTDLYAMLLDPKTGKRIRHIYLCGTGGGPFNSLRPRDPAVADGVVFIPTDRGLLLALEVSTGSIGWAVRYGPTHDGGSPTTGWLPTPPIAVADVVLLAPGDADYLFCFDRATGEIRWQVRREEFRCLLGATDTHVWMAGHDVQLVEIETGEPVWRRACGPPSGRGVVTGNRLYLPTVEGVVVMNALTGEKIAIDPPAARQPLGNLLAWDGSLYSVGMSRMRKFPDLAGGYAEAVARHAADPADPSRAIRLAWLELLKAQPAKALAALAKVPETTAKGDQQRYGQVIHLRVRSMLDLAASGEVPPGEALALLREARTIAESPADAIRSALALGDHYHRQGQPLDACLPYLSIVFSEKGDGMVSAEAGFEQRARDLAATRIEKASKGLSEAQARTLEGRVREWLHEGIDQHDGQSLLRLAETPALGDLAHEANLWLGIWAADDLRFEQAEGFFADILARARSPELLAEAAARLAAIYLEPAELHLPVSAVKLLDRLEHEFAAVELPANILDIAGAESGSREASRQAAPAIPAAQVAAALRKRVDSETLARHRAAMAQVSLGQPGEPTAMSNPGARPLSIRGPRQEPLADLMMTLVDGNRVEARSQVADRLLWSAELRLLGEPAVEMSATRAQRPAYSLSGATGPARAARAVADGQMLIVNSAYGLHAIGLLTGRRLWSRRFDPPCPPGHEPSGCDAWVWAHEGYLVSVSARGRLGVSRSTRGERIRWCRKLPQRQWYAVRARNKYVVAVDYGLERVDVFRLADGRFLGQCGFTQGQASGRKVNIALYDDVICGPVSGREVAGLELATPGAERWRVSMPDETSQIFKPTPGQVAIADRSGRIRLIDPNTGQDQMATTVYACEEGVVDGALVDDVLYVCGYQVRAKPNSSYDRQRWALAAVRAQDGRILWQRGDIGAGAYLNGDLLRVSSDAIPVAVFTALTRQQAEEHGATSRPDEKAASGIVELTMVDKATGETIGETVAAGVPRDAGASRVLDVQVWPGQVVVTAGSLALRFPIADRRPAAAGQQPRLETRDRRSGG